jgi:hypothetical protein
MKRGSKGIGFHLRRATLIAFLFIAALICPFMAQAQNDNLIVPGVRLGPVHLGITDVELYRLLGDPAETIQDRNLGMIYHYSKVNVIVSANTHRVTRVGTSDPDYSTVEGIRVGSSGLAVGVKLGIPPGPCDPDGCNYWYPSGLSLNVTGTGSVRAISVAPAAR